jgi:ketosteroid isomerase-like protein
MVARTIAGSCALGDTARVVSQNNVELVRRVFDASARRDAATILSLYDPGVEWEAVDSVLMGGRYQGHEGLRRFWREWYGTWQNVEDTLEELIDAGEHVISVVRNRGRGRASGADVEYTQYAVWTIREGKVVRVLWFGTREEAFEAAGQRRARRGRDL